MGLAEPPKGGLVESPKGGLVESPKGGLVESPKGGLAEPPKGGLVEQRLKNDLYPKIKQLILFEQIGTSDSYKATY